MNAVLAGLKKFGLHRIRRTAGWFDANSQSGFFWEAENALSTFSNLLSEILATNLWLL
jgi:hypothetical protein